LSRLHHGFTAKVYLYVRLHRKRIRAVGAGAPIEVHRDVGRGLSKCRVLIRRHSFRSKMRRVRRRERRDVDPAFGELLAQSFHLALGLDLQRIIGLHA
jgi:hypothetical protein